MATHPGRCRNLWHRRNVCNNNRLWLGLGLIERIFRDEDFSDRGKEIGDLGFGGGGGNKEVGFGKEVRYAAAGTNIDSRVVEATAANSVAGTMPGGAFLAEGIEWGNWSLRVASAIDDAGNLEDFF